MIDYFKKSIWQRLFDDKDYVRSEMVSLPKKMSGEEILGIAEKNEDFDYLSIEVLPYENGLSIIMDRIRFAIDLSQSPGGSMGCFQPCEVIYDYDDVRIVPLGRRIVWGHLKEVLFDKVYVTFFRRSRSGYSEKRICYKCSDDLISLLFQFTPPRGERLV